MDASLALAWLLPEEMSGKAFALKEMWDEQSNELIAPPLLPMEVGSALRLSVHRGRITLREGDEALQAFLEMRIRIHAPEGLLTQAWALAKSLNAPRLYDMYYLALAQMEQCELWTLDHRLVNLSSPHLALVRWVGDIAKEGSGG